MIIKAIPYDAFFINYVRLVELSDTNKIKWGA